MKSYRSLLGILLIIFTTIQCSSDDSSGDDLLPPVVNPIADFASNTTTIRVGTGVQFVNRSTNGTSFEWSFDGGTPATSTEVEPFIVYNNLGTYSVSLTAINADGTNTLNKENFINVVE